MDSVVSEVDSARAAAYAGIVDQSEAQTRAHRSSCGRRFSVLLGLLVACGPAPEMTTGTTGTAGITSTSGTSAATAMTTVGPTTSADDTSDPLPPSCPGHATTGEMTTADTADTADTPAPSCPEHSATDACCCFVDIGAQNMSSEGTVSVCGVQELCPAMHFVCPSRFSVYDCPTEALTTDDEAAIGCALQALAGGEVGRLSWVIDDEFTGYSREHVELDLVGDGTMYRQGGLHVDFCFQVYAVDHLPVVEASYFADCLTNPDWRVRFDCIRQALTCPPLETCINSYYPDIGFLRGESHDRRASTTPVNGC